MALDGFYEMLPSPPHTLPGWASWTGLTQWIRSPMKPPAFVLGDIPGEILSYYNNQIGEADTGVFTLKDVELTSKGFLIRDNKAIANNYIGHSIPWCTAQVKAESIKSDLSLYQKKTVDQAVMLIGSGYDVYGHWIVDILPKLYGLKLASYDVDKLVYLIPSDIPAYGREFLKIVGLSSEQLYFYNPSDELLKIDQLLVPTLLRSGSRASSIFKDSVDYFKKRIQDYNDLSGLSNKAETKSIFVSRSKAHRDGRALANRREIEQIAVEAGYTLMYPEQLSIIEQIKCFSHARNIIGEYGSGLHNTIFSNPGALVCCLRGTSFHPGFLQSGLANVMNQGCGYVFGSSGVNDIHVKFSVKENDFRQALQIMSLYEK